MQFITHYSGSSGNLYHVKSDAGELIIDPGVTISKIKKSLSFKISGVSACLCSHSHGDHSKGLPDIVKMGIDSYFSSETAKALKLNGHRSHIIEPLKQFEIGKFKILPFPTQHDCPGAVGFLISDGSDKLVFATDTFYVRYKFNGLTHIAIECNYSKETMAPDLNPTRKKRLYSSHFSLENVIKFLKANDLSKVREIHLLHLSRDNADPDYFRWTIQKLTAKPTYIGGQ